MNESKFAQRNTGNTAGEQGGNGDSSLHRHSRELVAKDKPKNNANSWDTYRRWLTRVQAPGKGRIPLDPTLYTWKGYRNWSDKVRRDWKPED